MRIEAAPPVYRFDDRRPRPQVRREETSDRRNPDQASPSTPNATGRSHVWFEPAFGAHILGQVTPERATAAAATRAYTQPEARTPLRPRQDQTA